MKVYATAAWALAALIGSSFGAVAQECPHVPAILSLSNTVIKTRDALPAEEARWFGTEAVYLTIRYGQPSDADVLAMTRALIDTDVVGAKDLYFAWLVATLGVVEAKAEIGPQLFDEALGGGLSTARAILLFKEWLALAILFEPLHVLPPSSQEASFRTLMLAVLDQPDAYKERLAKVAIGYSQPLLAAAFVASERDASAWKRLMAKFGPRVVDQATRLWRWVPGLVGNPPLPRTPRQKAPADPALTARMDDIIAMANMQPEVDFLLSFVNMSGWVEEGHSAATALVAAIGNGEVSPTGSLDEGWLVTYRALLASGRSEAEVRKMLAPIGMPPGRYSRGKIIEVMDWIIAVEALGPYVRGETAKPPFAPPPLADAWPSWLAAAEQVRAGTATPYGDGLGQVAELMLEAGQTKQLADLLGAAIPSRESIAVADDMAKRLDRLCAAYLHHPGESIHLTTQSIFKFD